MKRYPKIRYPNDEDSEGLLATGDIVIQEKLDGCLPYNQRIQTEDGAIPIGKIVNSEMDVRVKSLNTETGEVEYKEISNYWNNGSTESWLKIHIDGVRSNSIIVTANHEIYTQSGKVQAGDLTKRHRLVSENPELTSVAKDMLIGSLLGDASVNNGNKNKMSHISESHGEKQHDYAKFKCYILGELISNTYTQESSYDNGHRATEKYTYTTKSIKSIDTLANKFIADGKKVVPKDIEITDRVLAILFCDDGSTSFSEYQRPRSTIHVQGFSTEEASFLLEKINISGRVANYGDGPIIEFTADGTEGLFKRINKYVPDCMSYKISDHFYTKNLAWGTQQYDRDSVKITRIESTTPHNKQKYDIEVEDNHNYFTKNILVSNSNFRFTLEANLDEEYHTPDRQIVFGSRNVEYKNLRDETKQFAKPMDYIRDAVNTQYIHDLQMQHGSPLTFFGEAMLPHTLEYDWENTPAFLGFDVYHENDGRFLTHTEMKRAFEHIDLEISPIIDIISAEAWDDYSIDVGESKFGDVTAEGLMFKNYDTQVFAKFVRDSFKEKNKKTFGASKKQQASGAEKLSYQYITNARIEKNAHKAVDEGPFESLKMEMMAPRDEYKGLPNEVIADMAEEEAVNIFCNERWEVDIGQFRSITASRCAAVLKQMIQKRAVEELK